MKDVDAVVVIRHQVARPVVHHCCQNTFAFETELAFHVKFPLTSFRPRRIEVEPRTGHSDKNLKRGSGG